MRGDSDRFWIDARPNVKTDPPVQDATEPAQEDEEKKAKDE